MSSRVKQLLDEALALSTNERAELAAELTASLDGEPDADVEATWAVEIERRARRAMSGQSKGDDWEVVRARIESALRRG